MRLASLKRPEPGATAYQNLKIFALEPLHGWNFSQRPDQTARYYTRFVDETADLSGAPDTRLAIYGTLAPGRVNHHQISALSGKWQRGMVKGKLFSSGWGAALGFPGLILDPLGPSVDVDLFESADLPRIGPVLTSLKEVATTARSQQ
jgi:gamma-glutamylcyclotransferase (GGCT)/AIG2-like uncharacterized protein YtfP